SRRDTIACSRSSARSRMIIAVISLVIEAMGTTASLFLLMTTSPVAASCTITAADGRQTTFCGWAWAKPMVRARTKNSANAATIPSREWSFLCCVAMDANLFLAVVVCVCYGHALHGAWGCRSLDDAH